MLKYCLPGFLVFAGFAAEPPKLRLPGDVQPIRYRAELTINPDQDTFSGRIEIDVDIRQATDTVWLNARGLTFDDAKLLSAGGTTAVKAQSESKDFAGFGLPAKVAPGRATLQIAYHGDFNKKSSNGLFKQQEGGDWYVFTQFESIDARQAFPCFDEPLYKVPWQLTVHVPRQDAAVSNSPVLSETGEGEGRKRVVFAETKPIPSYLVALGVGPFAFADAGKAGKKQIPIRIVTPRGKAAQARYAVEVTGQILDRLENYFGIPYPYEKLDAMAVPLFGGAMENPGLITYGQTIILSDAAQDSIERQREYAEIAAHEMAHQWFGDLVTTAWWDDIWLNEAFASWMGAKVLRQWKPEWNTAIDEQNSRLGAMRQDSLVSARKIRQPIESDDDITNAFDGITYSKGEAVIRMFESWAGERAFQQGVQRYIKQYSWRTATAGDFLDSVASAAKPALTKAFSTFLDQPGLPLVSVTLNCDTAGGATLHLSQKRALPLGSPGAGTQTWQIPVCARYGEGDADHRDCVLLTRASMDWKLPEAKSCPAWVQANADGAGYYRARYEGDLLGKLLADGGRRLPPAERVAALGDVAALATMGEVKAGDALALVPQFAADPVRQVVSSTIGIVSSVRDHLVPRELLPNYERFVNRTFGERARQLGWKAKPGEDPELRLLRESIVPVVALWGGEPELAAEARKLAGEWLSDRRAIDPDMAGPVLNVAARNGDEAFFKRLQTALPDTKDRRQREIILSAMGSFRDPAIARSAMELLLKPGFDLREANGLIFGALAAPDTRAIPFEFVKKNYDALVARIPAGSVFGFGEFMPFVGAAFCDEKSRAEVQAFFEPRIEAFPGTKRNLAQVLERIRICTAYKSAQEASVAEFFRKY